MIPEDYDGPMPMLPRPAVMFADHSYPAFSQKQMLEYAEAVCASRLTRQEDETRRAALEEALSCAKAWRFVPAEFIVPAAMTAEELVIAQRTAKGIEDAIRDLMEAGHGVR